MTDSDGLSGADPCSSPEEFETLAIAAGGGYHVFEESSIQASLDAGG